MLYRKSASLLSSGGEYTLVEWFKAELEKRLSANDNVGPDPNLIVIFPEIWHQMKKIAEKSVGYRQSFRAWKDLWVKYGLARYVNDLLIKYKYPLLIISGGGYKDNPYLDSSELEVSKRRFFDAE